MRSGRTLFTAVLAVSAIVLWTVPAAPAADSVFWSNFSEPGAIGRAPLGGGGGSALSIAGVPAGVGPVGAAIDAAAGRLYWGDITARSIDYANLDGSGAHELNIDGTLVGSIQGLTIDPLAGRVYWSDRITESIKYANLDGSGGGPLNTTGATVNRPFDVALDPVAGRVYWANFGADVISYANLDGSGGGDLKTGSAPVKGAIGVAVDVTAGRVYWTNAAGNSIAFANLDGSGGKELEIPSGLVKDPVGVAIDAEAGRVYWANGFGNTSISFANLDGSAPGSVDTTGAPISRPTSPSLLKTPAGAGAPILTGTRALGSVLSCSKGSWAADQPGAFLYRVPQSFSYRWSREGVSLRGATASTLTVRRGGHYTCTVTATNAAGSATQVSPSVAIAGATVRLGRLKRDEKRGTATLSVKVSTPGALTVAGKLVLRRRVSTRRGGVIEVPIKANRRGAKRLGVKGSLRVRAKFSFVPAGSTEKIVRKKSFALRKAS